MTSVYKNRRVKISDSEKVRIPDAEFDGEPQEEEAPPVMEEPEQSESELPAKPQDGPEEAESPAVKKEEIIEEPPPKFPSKEELYEIYKADLIEVSRAAAEKGYWDAFNKKKAELQKCITDVKGFMDQITNSQNDFMRQYTDELKYMALEIAEKMIYEKIGEDDMILKKLVMHSVNSVKNTEWLNLEISDRLAGLVELMHKEFSRPEHRGKAYVFPVAGAEDICRVSTENGTIVSTVSTQAENLRKAFKETDQAVSA